jgi:hypothetical protein
MSEQDRENWDELNERQAADSEAAEQEFQGQDIREGAGDDVAFPPTPDQLAELPDQDEPIPQGEEVPGPEGETYIKYSDEQRTQLATERLTALMGAHAKIEGMITFLAFAWSGALPAFQSDDPRDVIGALESIRSDVNDVAAATNELVATYAGVLNELAKEALDTADYDAWRKGRVNGDPQG